MIAGFPNFSNFLSGVPQKLRDLKDWSFEQPKKIRTLSANPTIARFQHYVPLLDACNDTFQNYRYVDELMDTGEKCYRYASNRKELDDLTLASAIFIYMKQKIEALKDVEVSAQELRKKKKDEVHSYLPVEKLTEETENTIRKFLEIVSAFEDRSFDIKTMVNHFDQYVSDVQNFVADETVDDFRKSCVYIVNEVMKPNNELFQLYYEGLQELQKTAPGEGVTSFIFAKVKDNVSEFYSNKVKRISTIKQDIRNLQLFYNDDIPTSAEFSLMELD